MANEKTFLLLTLYVKYKYKITKLAKSIIIIIGSPRNIVDSPFLDGFFYLFYPIFLIPTIFLESLFINRNSLMVY